MVGPSRGSAASRSSRALPQQLKSSGSATSSAPASAAPTTSSSATFRFRALSGVEVSWTAATRTPAKLRENASAENGAGDDAQNGARQGAPEHGSTTAPSSFRNSDFWSWAAGVARGRLCGSSPNSGSNGGTFPSGGAGLPLSQKTIAEPLHG